MLLKKGQGIILLVNALYLALATYVFLSRKNYEFILYVGVIIALLALILATNKRVNYPNSLLWLLTLWAFLHMLGGGLMIEGKRLYELILIPISATYEIFKYDQFVHIIGFGVATLVMYILIKPLLKKESKYALPIVIIMAGLGVGALNEMLEFLATVITPETGVGGYINTSLDLVADLIGAILAWGYICIRKGKL